MAFLCVDIGGTNTLLGVGNGDFSVVDNVKTVEFLNNITETIENTLDRTEHGTGDIEDVAVAAAGPLDREKGVFYPPNFVDDEGLTEVQLREPLEKYGSVRIVNDCSSAVLGEYYYGDHDTENLVYITISSGIGAGVVLNGRLVEAWEGNFAEVGHMKVGEEMTCGCGRKGHWEAYCSGNSLPKVAEELYDAEFEDAREIFDSYLKGDVNAHKTIAKMNDINVDAVSDVANIFNPEVMVFGGAVALNHPETVIEPLKKHVGKETVNGSPEIKKCDLGHKAVIHGLRAICNGKTEFFTP